MVWCRSTPGGARRTRRVREIHVVILGAGTPPGNALTSQVERRQRDPALAGYGVQEIGAVTLLEDGRIA